MEKDKKFIMAIIKKDSIKTKIILAVFLGVLLPIVSLIIISSIKFKNQSEEIAKNLAIRLADNFSNNIENVFNEAFTIANTYADIQTSMISEDGGLSYSSDQLERNQIALLKNNEQALALYSIYLPGHVINPNTGELNEHISLLGNTNYKNKMLPLNYWEYSFKSNVLDSLKKGNGFALLPPYLDVYDNDTLRMISYLHAIKQNDEIIGMAGIDISIDWIQNFISDSKLFNNSTNIMIVSDRGIINANNLDKSMVGKSVTEGLPNYKDEGALLFSDKFSSNIVDGNYIFYRPIKFNKLKDLWHIRIAIPEDQILGEAKTALLIRLFFGLGIAIVSLIVISYFFNTIIRRIVKLAEAAKRMAKGNLFIDFNTVGNDEITDLGKSLQSIIVRFSDIIKGLKDTMKQLNEAGNSLSETAIKLSEGASEQASSTEEVSASMEQMSANIDQNAENAKNANIIAKNSSSEIEISSKNVKQTADSMDDIAKKTSIIGDIAFQVNILALNAAVEAARAGVHGRGFGVVANEVGKLADRSKLAASEIDELTNKSFQIAKQSGLSLEQIVPEIKKTAVLVEDITNASIEQKAGAEQINNAIQQLNNVTQQNASSAEQLATNVESLTMLSDKLNKLISFFKLEASRKERTKENQRDEKKKVQPVIIPDKKVEKPEIKKIAPVENIKKEEKNIEKKQESQIKEKRIEKGFNIDLGDVDESDDGFERF